MSDFEMYMLRRQIWDLQGELIKEQERVDKLIAAISTGEVCDNLGHDFPLPDMVIRNRISESGWEIPRVCARCGDMDGNWGVGHWTLRPFPEYSRWPAGAPA